MPIRLVPNWCFCLWNFRVIFGVVQLGIGRRLSCGPDTEQALECVERVEPSIEPEGEFV